MYTHSKPDYFRLELQNRLHQSKEQIMMGFKALLQNKMPAPFAELERLLSMLQKEIELVTFVLL